MGYMCHATNEIVNNEPRVMIPVKVRKVVYIGQNKPDPRSDYLQFAGQSEGWEIVQEVPVRQSKEAEFLSKHSPAVVGTKEVRFMKPRPKKDKFIKRQDDIDDKPED